MLILYPQNDHIPREEKLINSCYQLIGEVSELVAAQTQKPEVKMPGRNRYFKYRKFQNWKICNAVFLFIYFIIYNNIIFSEKMTVIPVIFFVKFTAKSKHHGKNIQTSRYGCYHK